MLLSSFCFHPKLYKLTSVHKWLRFNVQKNVYFDSKVLKQTRKRVQKDQIGTNQPIIRCRMSTCCDNIMELSIHLLKFNMIRFIKESGANFMLDLYIWKCSINDLQDTST